MSANSKIISMSLAFPEPLADKYKMTNIEDYVGLKKPRAVMQAFAARPYPAAWFFVGKPGTGKTTMALAMCDLLNGQLHHIPSRQCDLERIEAECRSCQNGAWNFWGPNKGKMAAWHVIVIDEADQMTGAAQLALLSKLDATAWPPKTIFFMTANGTQLLEPRFLSRCKVLEFTPPVDELAWFLAKIYKLEGGKRPLDFAKVSAESHGNVRDALNRLEIELLVGSSVIPEPASAADPDAHEHKCGDCQIRYDCAESDCRMKFKVKTCPLGGRPPCAGATTEGAERGRRAWQTRKEKNQ